MTPAVISIIISSLALIISTINLIHMIKGMKRMVEHYDKINRRR